MNFVAQQRLGFSAIAGRRRPSPGEVSSSARLVHQMVFGPPLGGIISAARDVH